MHLFLITFVFCYVDVVGAVGCTDARLTFNVEISQKDLNSSTSSECFFHPQKHEFRGSDPEYKRFIFEQNTTDKYILKYNTNAWEVGGVINTKLFLKADCADVNNTNWTSLEWYFGSESGREPLDGVLANYTCFDEPATDGTQTTAIIISVTLTFLLLLILAGVLFTVWYLRRKSGGKSNRTNSFGSFRFKKPKNLPNLDEEFIESKEPKKMDSIKHENYDDRIEYANSAIIKKHKSSKMKTTKYEFNHPAINVHNNQGKNKSDPNGSSKVNKPNNHPPTRIENFLDDNTPEYWNTKSEPVPHYLPMNRKKNKKTKS